MHHLKLLAIEEIEYVMPRMFCIVNRVKNIENSNIKLPGIIPVYS